MLFLRRTFPLIIAFVLGSFGAAQYYIPAPWSQATFRDLVYISRIVWTFALFLGMYSLFSLHIGRMRRKQAGWGYSGLVFAAFGITFAAMAWNSGGLLLSPLRPTELDQWFTVRWMYTYVFAPCDATMFSLLAFFIASAAYRTFRARTPEATILLVAAVVLMLGRVPALAMLYDIFVPEFLRTDWLTSLVTDDVRQLTEWLMNVPNLAAKRGLLLGVSLGAIATSLRIIFGIERSYLGGGGD